MRTFTRKTNKQEKKIKLLTLLVNSKDRMFIPGLAKPHTSLATGFTFGFQVESWVGFPSVACHSFASRLKFDFLTRLETNSMEASEHALGASYPTFCMCTSLGDTDGKIS